MSDETKFEAETRVPVQSDSDIVVARQQGRAIARELGFTLGNATLIATAISELARNIVQYATRGEVILRRIENGNQRGLVLIVRDEGPGIPDVLQAMQDGYSTSGRLGLGLPGVRRLMDEFDIESEVGKGTTVTVSKWKT
ncbi:MAG: anti-sigma regulatory factor [Candidatus Eisenbacteria bacterium]|uniref:Anti-sigma regulatory factor n=1 Tax=Eiseniibacteriota bacterium TaxID=2212470 RepID=A0A538T1L6_UNCEI|nr:MAG: anti-sigma regulatory factor [Candidatus Eisenbacteria bacterium]